MPFGVWGPRLFIAQQCQSRSAQMVAQRYAIACRPDGGSHCNASLRRPRTSRKCPRCVSTSPRRPTISAIIQALVTDHRGSSRSSSSIHGTRQKLRTAAIEAKWYPMWESRGYFKPSWKDGRAAVLHPAAAAERHRHAAHGSRVPAHDDGRADSLAPDARLQHAVAARHRSRRHRDADRRREPAEAPRARRARDLGREKFVERVWQWKEESGSTITQPDAPTRHVGRLVARALHDGRGPLRPRCVETFVRLFDDGLIYRGKRLVNWDPKLGTAVSDLEVENEEEQGKIWEIRYPRVDGKGRHRRRDDAARDDAGRRRGRGESRRRALHGIWSARR